MPQFVSPESQDETPPREFVAAVTVTAGSLDSLARVLTILEAFEHLPGVTIEAQADGLTETFYGWEKDVWQDPEKP